MWPRVPERGRRGFFMDWDELCEIDKDKPRYPFCLIARECGVDVGMIRRLTRKMGLSPPLSMNQARHVIEAVALKKGRILLNKSQKKKCSEPDE